MKSRLQKFGFGDILEDEEGNPLKGVGEIIIAKHRNGATDTVKLKFIPEYAKFTNLEDNTFGDFDDDNGAAANNPASNIITLGSRMNDEDIPF